MKNMKKKIVPFSMKTEINTNIPKNFIEYHIDEKRGVIACTIKRDFAHSYVSNILYRLKKKHIIRYESIETILHYGDHYPISKQQLVGVAKCSPNDEFDIDKGKKIALDKLSMKIWKFIIANIKEEIKYKNDERVNLQLLIVKLNIEYNSAKHGVENA